MSFFLEFIAFLTGGRNDPTVTPDEKRSPNVSLIQGRYSVWKNCLDRMSFGTPDELIQANMLELDASRMCRELNDANFDSDIHYSYRIQTKP